MKTIVFTVSWISMTLSFSMMMFWTFYIKWYNPDMTEQRLFITYWQPGLEITMFFILSAILFERTRP